MIKGARAAGGVSNTGSEIGGAIGGLGGAAVGANIAHDTGA